MLRPLAGLCPGVLRVSGGGRSYLLIAARAFSREPADGSRGGDDGSILDKSRWVCLGKSKPETMLVTISKKRAFRFRLSLHPIL